MTYLVDEMRKQLDLAEEGSGTCGDTCCGTQPGVCNCPKPCDCGPDCPCHKKEVAAESIDDVMDDNINENDIFRMKELAGMAEDSADDEEPIEEEEEEADELDEKLESNIGIKG